MCSGPIGVFSIFFPGAIGERRFHPVDVFLDCDFPFAALVSPGDSLVLPLLEIILADLLHFDTGGVPLVVFAVNMDGVVALMFLLVVFLRRQVLTGAVRPLRNAVAVAGIVVALHDEIASAPSAFPEPYLKCFDSAGGIPCGDEAAPPHGEYLSGQLPAAKRRRTHPRPRARSCLFWAFPS